MIEDGSERDLVIEDGVIADASPVPGIEPDASGWVLPGLVDVHNHLSLASPAGDDESADIRVRASGLGLRAAAAGDETSALSHLADAITRSRPQRGGHLWSHVWALTDAIPFARRAGDPRTPAWHDEALTRAAVRDALTGT